MAAIEAEYAEENNPLDVHYDAAREVRAKGAGFYQFSGDEETRRRQMDELRAAREETARTRQETGAADVRPGEAEGLHEGAGGAAGKSRAMEKRKRELEERRKMLDAKRRKIGGTAGEAKKAIAAPVVAETKAEKCQVAADPFAALEAQQSQTKGKGKSKATSNSPVNDADAFLAQLEQDMLKSAKK